MPNIESAYVYLFDCFPKTEDKSENKTRYDAMILKLYNLTGIHPKMYQPGGKIELIVDEMVSTAEETRCVWEIPDLQVLLQSPNQASTASKPVSDLDLTKKMVKGVKIFWNEIDKLPFFSLTFCLTVDAKGVEPKR